MSAATSSPDPSVEPVMKVVVPLADLVANVDSCHRLAEWSAHFLTSDMPAPQHLRARISEVVHELLVLMRPDTDAGGDVADGAELELSAARNAENLAVRLSCPVDPTRADAVSAAVALAQSADAARGWHDVLAGRSADTDAAASARATDSAVTMLAELAAVANASVSVAAASGGSQLTLDAHLPLASA